MLTIIHGADFHLDAPFAALPPDKARARRAEQRELLDRLAGLAEERRADVVLLSGDLPGDRTGPGPDPGGHPRPGVHRPGQP